MKVKLLKIIELLDSGALASGAHGSEIERDLALELLRDVYSALKYGDGWRARPQIVDPKVIESLYGSADSSTGSSSTCRQQGTAAGSFAQTREAAGGAREREAGIAAAIKSGGRVYTPQSESEIEALRAPEKATELVADGVFERTDNRAADGAGRELESTSKDAMGPISRMVAEYERTHNRAIERTVAPELVSERAADHASRSEQEPVLRPDPFMEVTLRAVPKREAENKPLPEPVREVAQDIFRTAMPELDLPIQYAEPKAVAQKNEPFPPKTEPEPILPTPEPVVSPQISRPEAAVQHPEISFSRPEIVAPRTLGDTLMGGNSISLKHSIGLNDRLLMIRDMFDGDSAAFDGAIARLDQFRSLNDAVIWLRDTFDWNADNRAAALLVSFLERKLGS